MSSMSETVRTAWKAREGPIVLATVDDAGNPNIIYATCVAALGEDKIVIADNYFDKTRKNLLRGCKGAVLFMTKKGAAYQLKGTLSYHKDGEYFDFMRTWNPPKHPGNAAAVLTVKEAYAGAEKLS